MDSSKQITLRKGERLPLFQPGGGGPQIFSAEDMNVLVKAINSLLNPKIIRGAMDEVIISDQNIVYQIGPDPQQPPTGSAPSSGYTGPLDSAVYVPSAGGHGECIAGVHGSRIFTFDATTGLPTGSQADYFASFDEKPKFGNATVCYDTVNDVIWAACVNGWFDWNTNSPNYLNKSLQIIDPTTLATSGSADLFGDYGAGACQFGSQGVHRLLYNPTTGWIDAVLVQNSTSTSISTGTGGFLVIDPASFNNALASYYDYSGIDGWVDGCVGYQSVGVRDDFWIICPGQSQVLCYDSIANSLRLTINIGFGTIPYCIEYCPDNDSVYFGTGGNYNVYTSAGVHTSSGPTIGNGYDAIRVKWNPGDHMLYFAIPGNGKVAIVDPNNSNSVVQKTGFDLPVDFVFTGSKNWCVQQGNVGLKEIV